METITIIDNRTKKQADFNIYASTLGNSVADISSLNKQLDLFTYDNGFGETAGCTSDIT